MFHAAWFKKIPSAHRQRDSVLQQDGARRRRVASVHGAELALSLSEPQQQGVQRLVKLLNRKDMFTDGVLQPTVCWCDYRGSASGGVWPDTAWAQNEVSSPSSPGHRRPESSSDWPRRGPPVAPAARRCRPARSGRCSGWWRSSDICSCWRSSASPDGPNEEEEFKF